MATLPTPPPLPTQLPPPTQTVPAPVDLAPAIPPNRACTNDATFIEDVTLPDRTQVEPGEVLDKRWAVRNSGSCNWGPGYRLVRMGEDSLQGVDEVALYPARAGATAIIRVSLTAPPKPGMHISRWRLAAPDGTPFGEEIYLWIEIPEATPTPTPFGTPAD